MRQVKEAAQSHTPYILQSPPHCSWLILFSVLSYT